VAFVVGQEQEAVRLFVMHVPGGAELAVFCAALAGAGLGFLWFNAYPAQVFMGDCGSLALGGAIGYVAMAIRQELLLVLVGGVFVVEALSVLLQVGWFKLTRRLAGEGRRIFLCAPIHHHYQRRGLHEAKISMRFNILAALCAVAGVVVILKVR
jgi:phospho-N-acetylmuramoyl-pentapeptide-transferase